MSLKGRHLNLNLPESALLDDGFVNSQPTLDLNGCKAEVAVDYTKRQNVFRLRFVFNTPFPKTVRLKLFP